MIQEGMVLDGIYQIIREIGHGGTGIIYLAYHLRLEKYVVVKKIKENFTGQMNIRGEVDILKQLRHTYLPQVYDFVQIGAQVYTVMDYIEGCDLQQYLDGGYQFPEERVILWMTQLTEVLEYLHRKESRKPTILHSDIKPGNIMITPDGNVCLIDFNISLDGESSDDIQGISPFFAAPEQYRKAMAVRFGGLDAGIVLDRRMDIYSLGATFYRVMTGCNPSPEEGRTVPITELDIPYSGGLKAVIQKAMQEHPNKRFATAGQMRAALADVTKLEPEYRRYRKYQIWTAFAYVFCLIVGGLSMYYGSSRNMQEKWKLAYKEFYEYCEAEDTQAMIDSGIEILDDFTLQSYLKKNGEKKAEVLHAVGDGYFRQSDYENAVFYYGEALETGESEEGYVCDYAAALARNGQTSRAERVLRDALLRTGEADLLEAEIALEREETDKAVELLEKLRAEETDSRILTKVYLLLADIYEERGDYARQMSVLQEAAQAGESRQTLRKIGQAGIRAAQNSAGAKQKYLEMSLASYERLCSLGGAYEDRLNFALAYRAAGQYRKSSEVLDEMKEMYPDDYRLYMWECYNDFDIARQQKNYEFLKADIEEAYRQAEKYYRAGDGRRDDDMEQLGERMRQIERK